MKDRYKTLMQRSFKDAYAMKQIVEKDYGIPVSDDMFTSMAMSLYHHRVKRFEQQRAELKNAQKFPAGSPNAGKH